MPMKYPAPLLAQLQEALTALDTKELRARYLAGQYPRSERTKDLNVRYRNDLLYLIPDVYVKFIKPVYDAGMSDVHVDTALRHCVPLIKEA